MGSGLCVPRSNAVVGAAIIERDPESDTHPSTPSTTSMTDHEASNSRSPVVQTGLRYTVDSTIPEGFHPPQQDSELERQCRAIIRRLAPKDSDVARQKEVREILAEWERSLQLTEIENHALSVPPSQTSSVQALAASLTSPRAKYVRSLCANAFHLQLAKVYAIYFWVATNIRYDVATWQAYLGQEITGEMSANSVLQERSAVCLGYAKLFQALAAEAGLQAEVITGHVKLWRMLSQEGPDSHFETNRGTTHDWNVVKLDAVWFPVDCTYGSGYVGPQLQFTPRYNRAYFATPPERLILTHLPKDESWQLLKSPVSVNDLQPLIAPQPQVFDLGLEPENWSESVRISNDAADPVVTIRLKAKPGLRLTVRIIENQSLEMHGIQTFDTRMSQGSYYLEQNEDNAIIRAVLPQKGRFSVVVHAHDTSALIQSTSTSGWQQRYQLCLAYQVTCDLDRNQSPLGYPIVYEMAASAFDFRLLHWNTPQRSHVQENAQGRMQIVFRAQPGLRYFHCLEPGKGNSLGAKLPTNTHNFSTMLLHDACDLTLHSLQVVFPADGWWTVHLCAARATNVTGTTGYTSIFRYVVLAKASLPAQTYPQVHSTENMYFDSVEPITASGYEVLKVPFTCMKQFAFHCYMMHRSTSGVKLEDYTRVASMDSMGEEQGPYFRYVLQVIFPRPGKWYVNVLAKDLHHSVGENYPDLFSLCLEVEGATQNLVFPTVNEPVADELGIRLLDSDPVSFADSGEPFLFNFTAPREVCFIPKLMPCPEASEDGESSYVDHCTLLVPADSGNPATYSLKVIFPHAGRWRVQVFAGKPKSPQYNLGIQIDLIVSNPMPDIAYPLLLSAFHNLGLTIPSESEHYPTSIAFSEFKLPFQAPENASISVLCDMQHASSGEKFNQNACIHYPTEEMPMHLLHIVFPQTGEWLVQLYAGDAAIDPYLDTNHSYQPILKLQLNALQCTDGHTFPQIYYPFRNTFGLNLSRDALPLPARIGDLPRSVVIPFYSPQPEVKFWHEVELEGKGMQTATRMSSDPATQLHQLEVEISEVGVWTVMLYAQNGENTSANWTAVLRHVVIGYMD